MMENDVLYRHQFSKISGTYEHIRANFGRRGVLTSYVAQEESDRLEEFFKKKFRRNSKFLVQSGVPYRKTVNKDLAALRRIYHVQNLQALPNERLVKLFLTSRRHLAYNGVIDLYDAIMERIFIPVLQEYLVGRLSALKKGQLVTECTNVLITPHKISEIYKERQQLFKIVRFIRRSKKFRSVVRSNASVNSTKKIPEIYSRIGQYFKRYLWMPVLVNNPSHTLQSVYEEIREWVTSAAPLKVKSKRLGDDYDRKLLAKSKRYMKEVNPPPVIRNLIEGLRAMAFLRTEDYVVMSQLCFYLIPLYSEIAKRVGLTYYELKEFLPDEITAALRRNKKLSKDELVSRLKQSCFVRIDSKFIFCSGNRAEHLKRIIEQSSRPRSKEKTFAGTTGNPGIARGKVRIALNPSQAKKTKAGEILVGSFMSAGFAPYLGKAVGIVTEFGGLTSHPVIVAREFNIPCLVGVKNVTKILKDGDLIDLDASIGMVRKIK